MNFINNFGDIIPNIHLIDEKTNKEFACFEVDEGIYNYMISFNDPEAWFKNCVKMKALDEKIEKMKSTIDIKTATDEQREQIIKLYEEMIEEIKIAKELIKTIKSND